MQRYKQSAVCANNITKHSILCFIIDLNQRVCTNTNTFSQIFSIVPLKTYTAVDSRSMISPRSTMSSAHFAQSAT